jgi:hypothetical protein
LGYVSVRELDGPFKALSEIGKMLNGLAASIEASAEYQNALKDIRGPRHRPNA